MSYFLAFAGFAALIILHEFGHFAAAKLVGMRVERFALFFPPLVLKRKLGETEYAVGAVPLGGYVKITGMNPEEDIPEEHRPRAYYQQPVWKRIVVIAAGPFVNIVIAFFILLGLNLFAATKPIPVVEQVVSSSPAKGELQPGDRVVAVDGKRGGVRLIHKQIISHKCTKPKIGCRARTAVKIDFIRSGKRRTAAIRPQLFKADGSRIMRIGIAYGSEPAHYGLARSASNSVDAMWFITTRTLSVFGKIFQAEERKQLSGLVGSYKVTQELFSFNLVAALQVLALISLSLAIINLFPFLPLDGGHIFFSLLEKIRGRRISFEAMQRASVLGFMLVLVLAVIGLSNDIDRLTHGGFGIER